jgi:hypothetical protein
MEEERKTLKQYCKEAKKRLKSGFWQNYKKELDEGLENAEKTGVSPSVVKQFYVEKVTEEIKNKVEDKEEFYQRVKKLLTEEGEVPNALGRLTDFAYYKTLTYEEQQRYNLNLSEKYLQAVERFRREKAMYFKI